ncbi:hypothetical protein ANCDUO_04568 [Ancylostoma duodenale]|uniref:Uncharacterized protein n=1 Tax=Ancylostoma duodenale TaxID=51022 RepID=A0A0C2GUM5_9BILA|nr:hypothetical protein ANCDUO_04568 [Ancylostoma duodenale]
MLQNLIQTPLVSELIPYIWDAHGSCAVLLGIARWMNEGFVTIRPDEQPRSWTSDREDEPWMIGGGFLSECSKIIAPQGPIMNLFANRALLPLSIVNYLIRPYTPDDLDTLATLSITSVEKPNNSYALQKEVFLDRFIRPFLETYPQHCFLAQEVVASGDIKVRGESHCLGFVVIFFQISVDKRCLRTSGRQSFVCPDARVHFIVEGKLCEIDNWFPIVPEDILEVYPAWLDARLLVDAYDAVPTKKLVQTAASTLYINGKETFMTCLNLDKRRIAQEGRAAQHAMCPCWNGRIDHCL